MYASIIELARCHCFLEFCHQHNVYHTYAIFFSWVGKWVAFALALMSFILAMLQSCPVAVSNQIPFDVFVFDSEQPGLFVMYINVASYYSYIKPEYG